jgi:hypothetical protein
VRARRCVAPRWSESFDEKSNEREDVANFHIGRMWSGSCHIDNNVNLSTHLDKSPRMRIVRPHQIEIPEKADPSHGHCFLRSLAFGCPCAVWERHRIGGLAAHPDTPIVETPFFQITDATRFAAEDLDGGPCRRGSDAPLRATQRGPLKILLQHDQTGVQLPKPVVALRDDGGVAEVVFQHGFELIHLTFDAGDFFADPGGHSHGTPTPPPQAGSAGAEVRADTIAKRKRPPATAAFAQIRVWRRLTP